MSGVMARRGMVREQRWDREASLPSRLSLGQLLTGAL